MGREVTNKSTLRSSLENEGLQRISCRSFFSSLLAKLTSPLYSTSIRLGHVEHTACGKQLRIRIARECGVLHVEEKDSNHILPSQKMTYKIELDFDCQKSLSLFLLKDVQNAAEIKEMVLKGTLDCCIVKPCLILHPFQIVVASNKAVLSKMQDKMTTRTLSTEILYNLSLSRNITQSLIKFGVGESDKNMLVIIIEESGEDGTDSILSHFKGVVCSIEELPKFSDEVLIKKTYKVKDTELAVSSLTDSIVTRIVTRDFTSV
jgi:tRNA threonylcarbamoyladenosine modification (KEOPS) complex Cgi121 subunit